MTESGYTKKEDLLRTVNAFRESRVLLTAVELDIFTILDTHMLTLDQILEKTGTEARATERLLAVLVGKEIINKTKTKYYNTDLSKRYLNKNSPEYLGMIDHANNLWNSWSKLTAAVRKGTSVFKEEIDKQSGDWRKNFIQAMHSRGTYQSEMISYMMDFSKVNSFLDIGGGSGAFTFTFLSKNEKMRATIFDLPNIVPITQEYIDNSGLKDRIQIIKGNYLNDEFPKEQDMILLSAIIHINSFEENEKLIQKCIKCLNPGGKLVILDYVMNEERILPVGGAMFSLNMLVGTTSGDTYTKKEISRWFGSAGVKDLEFKPTSFDTTLVVGTKN